MKGYWLACSRHIDSREQAKNWTKLSWKGEGSLALISLFFPCIAFALAVYDLTHSTPSGAGGRGGGYLYQGTTKHLFLGKRLNNFVTGCSDWYCRVQFCASYLNCPLPHSFPVIHCMGQNNRNSLFFISFNKLWFRNFIAVQSGDIISDTFKAGIKLLCIIQLCPALFTFQFYVKRKNIVV